MNNEKKQVKNSKGLVIYIFILSILVIGLIGYIVYDKMDKEKIENKVAKKEKTESDITESNIAKELEQKLISKDHSRGLYFNSKISSSDNNNPKLIMFDIKNYILDNNIDINKVGGNEISDETTYKINKDIINNYMNKKYNMNLTYDLPITSDLSNSIEFGGIIDLVSLKDDWGLVSVGRGGGDRYIANKLLKAKKDGNYIYIYDTAVTCSDDVSGNFCYKSFDYEYEKDYVYTCYNDVNEYDAGGYKKECLNNEEFSFKLASKNALKDTSKLNIYKSTFKKENDNYYWISTEPVSMID